MKQEKYGLDITSVNTVTSEEEEEKTRDDTQAGALVGGLRGSSLSHRLEVLDLIHVTLQLPVFP